MSTFLIEITPTPQTPTGLPAKFDPPSQVAKPYDTITWHNGDDKNAHYPAPIINGVVQKTGWFDYQIPPGGTSDTLAPGPNPTDPTKAYVLNYACALHPNETGQITIQP